VQADLTKEDDVAAMFEDASRTFGPVQVIIVNHGYWPPEDIPVARMTLDQWNSTVSTDLTSAFLVARRYLNGLERATAAEKDKAAIVMIGSTAGKLGEAGHADYAACKSGESR
jgi:NAD(P)-dependent dehydrogenase (short-subunit alcohol dehydrogenase family)